MEHIDIFDSRLLSSHSISAPLEHQHSVKSLLILVDQWW